MTLDPRDIPRSQHAAANEVAGDQPKTCPLRGRGPRVWLKRFGAAGFIFFLLKGLLWLTIPAAIALSRSMNW